MPTITKTTSDTASLIISAEVPQSLKDTIAFFGTLDTAYKHLRTLELFVADLEDGQESAIQLFPTYERDATILAERYLLPEDGLFLVRAKFESEGFWGFLGPLNPLLQIRMYLQDRHERKKDIDYRNKLERRRLELEIGSLWADNLEKLVNVLKLAGFTKPQIRQILIEHYHKPLAALGEAADKAGVTDISVESLPDAT